MPVILSENGGCGAFFTDPTGIVLIVVMGLLLVAMIVVPLISRRRKKAQNDELDSNLQVGDRVLTAGGIIGTIVDVTHTENGKEIMIETGHEESKTTILFDARGILQNLSKPPTPTNFFGMPKKNAGAAGEPTVNDQDDMLELEDLSAANSAGAVSNEDVFAPTSQPEPTPIEPPVIEQPTATVEPPAAPVEVAPVKPKTTRSTKK